MAGVALRDTGLSLSDVCVLARAADDAGYSSVWFPEVGSRDAAAMATLAGHHTHQARVGTGVIPVFSRNPVSLALAAATASEASNGRFILGLGAGHRFTAQGWYDHAWEKPRARLRETVTVVRRILSGERTSHDGTFHVSDFHLTSEPPPVPIYLGALTPESLRLSGEVADGAILNWLPPEGMERSSLLAREAAADAGRTVRVVGYVRAAVAEGEDAQREAMTAVREHTYMYVSLPTYASALRQFGFGQPVDRLAGGDERALAELTDALCACGDAGAVRSKIDRFADCGLDEVIVYPVPFGDDPAASILRTIRALVDPS